MSIQGDVNEDNEIACFKPGKPLRSVLEGLKAAMAKAAKELVDPFTESDIGNDKILLLIRTGKKMKTLILSIH